MNTTYYLVFISRIICKLIHRFVLTALLMLSFTLSAHAEHHEQTQAAELKKILFVGNSFSFYNNGIHNHLGSLIRANGDWQSGENRLRLQTLSGGHIHEHLEGLQATLSNDTRPWQAVVLQGHSNEPLLTSKKARFEHSLASAIGIVREHDLSPVLFMTWGYKGDEKMASELAQAYIEQGAKHKVKVVPVGLAFTKAEQTLPTIDLFVKDVLGIQQTPEGKEITFRTDIKHPSEAGTYLAACVFYASLYKRSPVGNSFTAGLDKNTAKALQALSWQVVENFQNSKLTTGQTHE